MLEGCCDALGLNVHRNLTLYFEQISISDHGVSAQSVYYSPPWLLTIECLEHLRACHSKSPLDNKAVIFLPDKPKFKAITKELSTP